MSLAVAISQRVPSGARQLAGESTFSAGVAGVMKASGTEGEQVYVSGAENWDDTWSIPADAEWDETVYEAESVTAKDAETGFRLTHARPLGGAELEFGVDYRTKKREGLLVTYEWEAEEEGQTPASLADYDLDGSVASVIEEKRLDPYIMLSGKGDAFSWEAGLRYETTKSDVEYLEDDESEGRVSKDYNELLPSVNLRWNLGDADRISLSLARTIKRPNFNELLPALLDGEFGDNDYIGNPELDPETANGLDLGFEHRLGRKGVVGVNFFYRDVKDLIEIVNTGVPSEEMQDTWEEMIEDGDAVDLADAMAQEPASSWLYTSSNVGDGKVYGFEFDVSTPLSAIGLENTGIFANYSWVKSKVDDFLGERRFNDQAKSVYNIGFIHDLPTLGASFGATYRKQGDAYARVLGEEALIRYGGELDVFVEKRFGTNVSVRLSANNLLDASKDEFFDKFDTLQDQIDRDYDEYELETEEAGPSYQLVMRWAF